MIIFTGVELDTFHNFGLKDVWVVIQPSDGSVFNHPYTTEW